MAPEDKPVDYQNPVVQKEVLERQRRGLWTPEQIGTFAKHFKLAPGSKLLDVGCGWGYCIDAYGPYCMPGGEIYGLDIEPDHVEEAPKRIAEDLRASTTFQIGDIYNLPFPDNSFDIAMAQIVLCHLDNPRPAIKEMIRVVKPGGCVAIFENASSETPRNGWINIFSPNIEQKLFDYKMSLHMHRAKRKRKHGDWSMGCYIPEWLIKDGLKNVCVRQNEQVKWLAPPYDSPDQRITYESLIERNSNDELTSTWRKKMRKNLLIGGASKKEIDRYNRSTARRKRLMEKALRNKELSYSRGLSLWCIWGFKSD